MTRILAGPFATMIMSDLGAEVVKVEAPWGGDLTRGWGPPFLEREGGTKESCYFLSVNRNKKSICVNMKQKAGQRILQQLAAQSDVLIENYVPGGTNQNVAVQDYISPQGHLTQWDWDLKS